MGMALVALCAVGFYLVWHSTQSRVSSLQAADRGLTSQIAALNASVGRLQAKIDSTPNAAAIDRKLSPSIFTIQTTVNEEGTAWVLTSTPTSSILITNYHVIADEWVLGQSGVTLQQGSGTFPAQIVAVAPGEDLAEIRASYRFPAIELSPHQVVVGEPVFVIGSPLGLGGSLSTGVVSALRQFAGRNYVQFTAPISPGNSGSPVVDGSGHVIGIAEAKFVIDSAEGLGLAIPIDQLCVAGFRC
jgi:putative serine protease PepD